MTPWNAEATAQDHLAAAREGFTRLPRPKPGECCLICGGVVPGASWLEWQVADPTCDVCQCEEPE